MVVLGAAMAGVCWVVRDGCGDAIVELGGIALCFLGVWWLHEWVKDLLALVV